MVYHIQEHGDCAGTLEAYSAAAALGAAAEAYRRNHGYDHEPVEIRATLCARCGCGGKCEPGTCGYCTPCSVMRRFVGSR